MYQVWETYQDDGCIEPVAMIKETKVLHEAIACAVQCQRPNIEIFDGKVYRSHIRTENGSWHPKNYTNEIKRLHEAAQADAAAT